jgi:hypothetical protein
MNTESGTYTFTGLGHQVDQKARKLQACRSSLEEAYKALEEFKIGTDRAVVDLRCRIASEIFEVNFLEMAAQNDVNEKQ